MVFIPIGAPISELSDAAVKLLTNGKGRIMYKFDVCRYISEIFQS